MATDTSQKSTVIQELQHLGLTGYEAKAYVAMIEAGQPLSGYEVAKRSRVPRSTIYETLGKLNKRGAAFEVSVNGGTAYLALPPEALLAEMRRKFQRSTTNLRQALPEVLAPPTTRIIHHLSSRDAVVEKGKEMISSATSSLYLAMWGSETELFKRLISGAQQRKVDVFFLAFGEEESDGIAFPHRLRTAPGDDEPITRRLLVIVSDRSSVLIGRATEEDMRAVYSDDPAVVLLAVEYVRHDIALQQLASHIGIEETVRIWEADEHLRRLEQSGLPGAGPIVDE